MIDATTFAHSYHALWELYAPACELFVRRLNLDGYERFDVPLHSGVSRGRRALLAEYAFSLFARSVNLGVGILNVVRDKDELNSIWSEVVRRLIVYENEDLTLEEPLKEEEMREACEIGLRLQRLLVEPGLHLTLKPVFAGCGYISASEGDVLLKNTLYEVKTVDRPFRSVDIRQLISYAAMNSVSKQFVIERIGIINPRRGTRCDLDIEIVSTEISGRPASELFWLLASAISSGELSR